MFLSQPDEFNSMEFRTTEEGLTALTDDVERNRLLAEMAEQSTDMISRHTPGDWRFIYVSPAVTHLLGYSVAEIIGISAYDLYHPDDVHNFERRTPNVRYDRGLYTHTYRFRCKDGRYIWLESTSRSLRCPETGEQKEILVVSRDASRRIEADQANRRLARVLESSSDLVLFIAPAPLFRLTHLNEAARNRLQLKDSYAGEVTLREVLAAESYAQLVQEGVPQADKEGNWRGELLMSAADQRTFPVSLELLAHTSLHGDVEYYSIVCRDLTEAKAAEAQLKQYQADIHHASRLVAMGELASSLAHELNQPLTGIVNYLRGITRRFSHQQEVNWNELEYPIEKASAAAMRAGELIHRMMDFTRKRLPQTTAVEVNDVIADMLQFCKSSAHQHNVSLVASAMTEPVWVLADRIQLEQILLNLLMNALEACQPFAAEPCQVWVETRRAPNNQLIVCVIDQGPGLTEEEQAKLFDRFYTTKDKGLGMGLAITQSLVESHNGELWIESPESGGASFCFSLTITEPPLR